jgi:hypothetical protein
LYGPTNAVEIVTFRLLFRGFKARFFAVERDRNVSDVVSPPFDRARDGRG